MDLVDPRQRVKNDHPRFGSFKKIGSDPVGGCVIGKSDRVRKTFTLEPGHIQNVEFRKSVLDTVMDDQFDADIKQILFDIFGKLESLWSDRMEIGRASWERV